MAIPLASRATKQTARKAPSLRVAAKCGVCVVALLGFVVLATTFVARLAAIRILPATRLTKDLIRGSLVSGAPLAIHWPDPDAQDEERFIALDLGSAGELLVVVYTLRGEDIRLISARRAEERARRP